MRRSLFWSSCAALIVAIVLTVPSVEAQVRKIATTVFGPSGQLTISSSAVTSTVPYLAPDGTVSAPSVAFSSQPAFGLYWPFAGAMALANGAGGAKMLWSSDAAGRGMELASDVILGWSSTASATGTVDVALSRLAADVMAPAAGDAYGLASKAWIRTAPTIASGFGTSPSVVASNGTAAFTINVGTGGVATGGVITMPAATTGYKCGVENQTGVAANRANQRTLQTASTTTTVTVQNQTISTGAALAWTASDILVLECTGY
jgi:hypothetical protein